MTARKLGEWTKRGDVYRRVDVDGTVWRITSTHHADVVLTMTYRDIRLTSSHAGLDAAKGHVEDMLRAFAARALRDYPEADVAIHNDAQQVCIDV